MSNLKYIAVYRIETLKIVNSYILVSAQEEAFKTESNKVCSQIKDISLQAEERQKINTSNGSWFCKTDGSGLAILVLGVITYPERHAYALIQEVQDEFAKLGNYSQQDDASLKLHIKKPLKDLGVKYNDLATLDKIYLAQQQVDETKIIMEDNVKKVLKNTQNLEDLSVKAENMNSNAKQFSKNATELASIMYWRNMKLKIMIGLIVLAGILYIVVPIIIKVSTSN